MRHEDIETAVTIEIGSMVTLTRSLTAALTAALADADRRPLVLDLRIDGPGPADWPGAVETSEVNRWERALRKPETSDVATVAVLGGTCSGPVVEIALACDLRLAEPGTTVDLGHLARWPGMGLYRLCQVVGMQPARRLLLTGALLDSGRAVDTGFLDVVDADLARAVAALVESTGEVADLRVARQLLHEAAFTGYDEALGAHLAACDRSLRAALRVAG